MWTMGKHNKRKDTPGPGLGLATTVKVDASPPVARQKPLGLGRRITGVARRFLPLRRPVLGHASHKDRPSPNPARYANMAPNKSKKLQFSKFRFSIVFALVLGLAGAGGYAMMSAMSRSFHKVTDVLSLDKWAKVVAGKPSRDGSGSAVRRTHSAGESSRAAYGASKRSSLVTQGRATRKSQGARQSSLRDPFYKQHHPISKKHAAKHRKWSKKLAKIKKTSQQKYHKAAVQSRKKKLASR